MTHHVLLDTNLIIAPPSAGFAGLGDEMAISTITVAELEYGVTTAADPLDAHQRSRRLHAAVTTMRVLPFGRETARTYGVLAAMVLAAGRNPRPRRLDLQIAATAVEYGWDLATRNPDDFRHLERALTVIPVKD